MLVKLKEGIKSKAFWAGVLTTAAGLLTGALTAPEAIMQLIKLIGG